MIYFCATEGADSDEPKKRQKRGGKGQVKTKKKDAGPKGNIEEGLFYKMVLL